MKNKLFGVGLGSTIFIFLLIATLALVRPVYLRIEESLSSLEKNLTEELEEKTGLAFSYQSLSPSLFVGVNIKNLAVYDAGRKNRVLSIKRAKLTYNVTGFFSKNPLVALDELVLNGVSIEYDAMQDSAFNSKVRSFLEKQKAKKKAGQEEGKSDAGEVPSQEKPAQESGSKISLSGKEVNIPIDVTIKNLSLHYSDKMNDALVSLKSLKLADFNLYEGVEIDTAGKFFYKTGLVKTEGKWTSFASNFSASGTLYPNLDGSSFFMSLSGNGGADYSLSRLDTLVNYSDNKIELRTMRTVLPFSLYASYDFAGEKLALSGDFEKFNPLKLVSVRKKPGIFRKIDGTTLTGSLSAEISKEELSYDSNLTLSLSRKVLGEPMDLSLVCEGDKNLVNLKSVTAKGNFIDAQFSGNFDIKRMQPSGLLTLNHFTLKNGGIISFEMFVDPYRNGFTCVAPQVFMNEKTFTALQFTALPGASSIDFDFEILDFAHPDYEETGRILVAGSFLSGKEKFVQANLSVSNIFADSIVDTVAFFMPAEKSALMKGLAENLRPFIFTTDVYFSSDLKDFSMNAPYCLFANTEQDRQLVSFALDGSRETLQLSEFDLIFGRQTAHAEASIEFADNLKEFSFNTALTFNSVPYNFFGTVSPSWIAISGDYNFDAIVSIDNQIGATVQFSQLPFSLGKYVFSASSNAILHFSPEAGFDADIVSFELEEPSSYLQFGPHLAFSGNLSKYGFVFNTLSYTDTVSSLDGNGTVVWNMNGKIFDSLHASMSAQSPISAEKISLNADLSNPSQLPFSSEALKNDFYISVEASLNSFPSARLLALQNPENTISADFTASGTISNPFVSMILHRSSVLLYGYPLGASGSFALDDTGLHVDGLNLDWSVLKVSEASASFAPDTFLGSASMTIDAELMGKNLHAPFEIKLEGSAPAKKFVLPDYYSLTLSSENVTGDLITSDFPLKLMVMRSPDRYDIFTDVDDGFRATYTADGKITAVAGKKSPVQMDLEGTIAQNRLNLNIRGIAADMRFICSEIEIPFVSFNSGILTGAFRITGPTTDPEFTGAFSVSHPNFVIPFISKNYLHAEKVIMTVGQGEAVVPPTLVTLGKGLATVEYRMEFNRWVPSSLELNISIEENRKVPLDLSFPFIHAKGLASGKLNLAFTIPRDVSISGFVIADNTDVEIVATPLQNQFSIDNILASVPSKKQGNINVTVDFDIIVGQKVQLLFNPFLRGVVAPGTPLSIYFDSYSGDLKFDSDIVLRGGEIAWLNRNFYMKEGHIVFNESQDSIDPKVTVRAETRERDANGNMVSIILSANNQLVSSFNPTFTSNPAKSEREIMQLLGQVISADSSGISDILGSGGDFFIQSTVMRRVENTLRELLNFDIFSIRTNILQNSLKLSMSENTKNKQLGFGNFIDNSTVYMGKYFGSSIYVDSMLHWSYDENKINNGTSVNGIIFQPEFGFEMTSPFVNIRLGVAPDIDSLQKGLLNTWVPSTSMTLSWKLAF